MNNFNKKDMIGHYQNENAIYLWLSIKKRYRIVNNFELENKIKTTNKNMLNINLLLLKNHKMYLIKKKIKL